MKYAFTSTVLLAGFLIFVSGSDSFAFVGIDLGQICKKDSQFSFDDPNPGKLPSSKASFYVCGGFLDSGPKYLISESDVHFVANNRNEMVYGVSSTELRRVYVDNDGNLRVIESITDEQDGPYFEEVVSCNEKQCKKSPAKCFFKRDLGKYIQDPNLSSYKKSLYDYMKDYDRMKSLSLYDAAYINGDKEAKKFADNYDSKIDGIYNHLQFIFSAAMNGDKESQSIFKDPRWSKILDGELAEGYNKDWELYNKINDFCKN